VQRAFRWAEKLGYIEKNPIWQIEKPTAGKRERIVTEDEYNEIRAATKDSEFRDLVTSAWETGARPQELVRVESRHVDLANSRWVLPPHEAKMKRRPRLVYLTDAALEITKRLIQQHPEGPFFRNRAGNPWNRFSVSCRFGRLSKTLGAKLCLYHFRHSFADRLLKAGVDALTVAILLGHADVSMLGKVYQHLPHSPDHLREQLRRIAG